VAWPKGRSRKPQPEQQQDAPAELLDADVSKGKPASKPEPKAAKAKADAPRAKWTLTERAKQAAEDIEWRDRTSDDLFALPEESAPMASRQ